MSHERSHQSIEVYLEALASSAPTPGGGSVVAVVGALAAALVEMVCSVTIGRPGQAEVEPALGQARVEATGLRRRFLELAGEDETAYGAYAGAAALPRTDEQAKAARTAAMQDALRGAADVPCDVAETGLRMLRLLEPVARLGNRYVLSDAEVAALLAAAVVRGAVANIRVNARLMKERGLGDDYERRAGRFEADARAGTRSVVEAVRHRTA